MKYLKLDQRKHKLRWQDKTKGQKLQVAAVASKSYHLSMVVSIHGITSPDVGHAMFVDSPVGLMRSDHNTSRVEIT